MFISQGERKQGHPFRGGMLTFGAGNCALQQWEMLGLCGRQGHGNITMDCSGQVRGRTEVKVRLWGWG